VLVSKYGDHLPLYRQSQPGFRDPCARCFNGGVPRRLAAVV